MAYCSTTGVSALCRITDDGAGEVTLWRGPISSGWTSLLAFELPANRGAATARILAYNMISGAFTFYAVDLVAKNIEVTASENWAGGWTSFMSFSNSGHDPHSMAYNRTTVTGRVAWCNITADGTGVHTLHRCNHTAGWTTFLQYKSANGTQNYVAYKRSETAAMAIRPLSLPVAMAAEWQQSFPSLAEVPEPLGSPLYTFIEEDIHKSVPTAKILQMSRIIHPDLWRSYTKVVAEVAYKNDGQPGCQFPVYHGSESNNLIMNTGNAAGFDNRLGRGSYGKGAYFAHNACYSLQMYPAAKLKQVGGPFANALELLVCELCLGEVRDFGEAVDSTLTRPPERSTGVLFDSVQGTEGEFPRQCNKPQEMGRQYVVFDQNRAYPFLRVFVIIP